MIAYPIGHPITIRRPYPNRPRIARIESSRVGIQVGFASIVSTGSAGTIARGRLVPGNACTESIR